MNPGVSYATCNQPMMPGAGSPIYLDYHATTPTDSRVAELILRHMTEVFGNASSADHAFGDAAEDAVDTARRHVAALVGAAPRDIVFTSGATESVNLAIQGLVRASRPARGTRPLRIGLMPVEHRAVLDTCEALALQHEVELHPLRVDDRAQIDLDDLNAKCRSGLDLVCVMAANNEVGTLYPIREVAAIAHNHSALFLTDATQAAGKVSIEFSAWDIDLLALSAHKLYGPKGVGALVVARGVKLAPLIYGGGHQQRLRSGTLNVPGIAGLGEACRLRMLEMGRDEPRIARQRDRLQRQLASAIPDLVVNGDVEHRLAGNLHVSIPGIPNGAVVGRLRRSVAISTGSACSSGIEAASHVLRAMRLPPESVEGALRIGIGKFTTDEEIARASELMLAAVTDVRAALHTAEAATHGRENSQSV